MNTREPLLNTIEPDDLPSKAHRPSLATTPNDAESGMRIVMTLFPN